MGASSAFPRALVRVLVLAAAQIALACGGESATAPAIPAGTVDTSHAATKPDAPPFPDLSRPATIYDEASGIYSYSASFHGGAIVSRYVFYEDGTFDLQFSSARFGFFRYAGVGTASGMLRFNDQNTAGPWIATATLRGDTLSVQYNPIMGFADFVDGAYVRAR